MDLLLLPPCPWVGRSIPRDEVDSHAGMHKPFPGVTLAMGERFPPARGALTPLLAAPMLVGVLPPCHPLQGPTGHNSVSPDCGHPSLWGWEKHQVSALFLPCPVMSLLLSPPTSLGSSPREPPQPRGIHIPHLGIISRHVTTPHSGFCSRSCLEAPSGVVREAEPVQYVSEARSPQGQWLVYGGGDAGTAFHRFSCLSLQGRISTQTNT